MENLKVGKDIVELFDFLIQQGTEIWFSSEGWLKYDELLEAQSEAQKAG